MKTAGLFLITLSLALLVGCGGHDRPVTIGLVPSTSPADLRESFEGIRLYLERELSTEVSLIVPEDYRELIALMEEGQADIALFGAFSYILADMDQALIPLVVRRRKDMGVTYNSLIITSAESGIRSIEDLEGRRFAFVNAASTSGFIIPYSLFVSRNIDYAQFFSSHLFVGSHDKVLDEVLSAKADAGVISSSILAGLKAAGRVHDEDIRIIWESDPIPGSPFVARAGADRKMVKKFTDAMLTIHEKDREALGTFSGSVDAFVPIEEGMYDGIRTIVRILGEEYVLSHCLE